MAALLGEDAHDAHARERLLQVRGDLRDLLARGAVGVGADDPERDRADPEHGEDEERQQRELPVEHDQDRRGADQRQRGAEQRHDPVGDELVERLHVVRQARDDHARLAARVEADRERLQVREELDPQVLQHALADPADEVGLRVGRAPVDERGDDERDDDEVERAGVAGHDPVVDRELGQRRRRERRGGAGDQRGEHQHGAPAVGPQQLEQPAQLAPAPAGRAPAPHDVVAPRGARPSTLTAPTSACSIGLRVRNTWSGSPFSAISAYSGERSSSSACVPRAAIRPSSSTTMSSASAIVESRWAITNVVRPAITSRSAVLIACSVEASTDEVASSRIRMRGSLSSARAIATRWRWPPESVSPRSPMRVS